MFGFIGRVLIYIPPIIVWVIMNQKLDELEKRKSELKEHKLWGKLFWVYGWAIGIRKSGTYVRYIITGIMLFVLTRWFLIITSTTPR